MNLRIINKPQVLLALLLPIYSFFNALRNPKQEEFKVIFVLFYTFVGLAFFYSGTSADVYRYVDSFLSVAKMRNISFVEYFHTRPIANQIDYYSSFSSWLISRFTSNSQFFLGILAFVYGLLFANNVAYIVSRCDLDKTGLILFILFIFTPSIPLLTHRWWTALQVFSYGALRVVFDNNYKKIIWCFLATILIHFSFIYPLIILIISVFLPKKNLSFYLVIYVVCNTISIINFDVITPYIENYLPELTVDRTIGYINSEELEHNFFSQSAKIFAKYTNIILVVLIYIFDLKSIKKHKITCFLFVVALLFSSFSGIASLTEWGDRYLELSYFFMYAFFLFYLSVLPKNLIISSVFKFANIVFVYCIAFQLRGFLAIIGLNQFFFGNYITTWFITDNESILQLLKS